MSIIVIASQNGTYKVTNRLVYPETVNVQLLNAINKGMVLGVLPLEYKQKSAELSLECNGLVPLACYLSSPVSKLLFTDVVKKLLSVIRNCEQCGMNPNFLDILPDRIFINPANGEYYCIYWPLVNARAVNPPYKFFRQFPYNVNFAVNEDISYVNEYKAFFSDGTSPFSFSALAALIARFNNSEISVPRPPDASAAVPAEEPEPHPEVPSSPVEPVPSYVFCTKCGKKNNNKNTFCVYCGSKLIHLK